MVPMRMGGEPFAARTKNGGFRMKIVRVAALAVVLTGALLLTACQAYKPIPCGCMPPPDLDPASVTPQPPSRG